MVIISFKSTPDNWEKEYTGVKRNTIRIQDDQHDTRFAYLKNFITRPYPLRISIENTITGDKFEREVTDVTKFRDAYMISW